MNNKNNSSQRTINVFLASSCEILEDRVAFGNLVRRLDRLYERRGLRVDIFEWEDYDASYNGRRKQDEYNALIPDSTMFVALFHKKAGESTLEEFNVAMKAFEEKGAPKIYIYFKGLRPKEKETPELRSFKEILSQKFGHYWSQYDNRDTMQLHFVMQLMLLETDTAGELKVDDGMVTLDGMAVALIDNLPFASRNGDYLRMRDELSDLPGKIEKAKERLKRFPEDGDLREDLQQKLNRYNALKKEFADFQQGLLDTAVRITAIQQDEVTDQMGRAIEAFNGGDIRKANIILDEIALQAERHIESLDRNRALVHKDIDALYLQIRTVLADVSMPVEERVSKAKGIYGKAVLWAEKSAYGKESFYEMLKEYGLFLYRHAFYRESARIRERVLALALELFGKDHPKTGGVHNDIGASFLMLEEKEKAMEHLSTALQIREDEQGKALIYNNLGQLHQSAGDLSKAMEYQEKALSIMEEEYGVDHPNTALCYSNIAVLYDKLDEPGKALEYLEKALKIEEDCFGEQNDRVARTYMLIGQVSQGLGQYGKALQCLRKAQVIMDGLLGEGHPAVANICNTIGNLYFDQEEYETALEYHTRAMQVFETTLGPSDPRTAACYHNVGTDYESLENYPAALEFFSKALSTQEEKLGDWHPDLANSYNNIGILHCEMGENEKALEYLGRALRIREETFGANHSAVISSLYNMAHALYLADDYDRALEYCTRALRPLNEDSSMYASVKDLWDELNGLVEKE